MKHILEHDSGNWVFEERVREGVREFSFDSGEHWFHNQAQAFRDARDLEKLVAEKPEDLPDNLPDDLAVLIMELLALMKALRPGDRLEIVHTGVTIQVVKQEVALYLPPSSLRDLEDRQAPKGGDD